MRRFIIKNFALDYMFKLRGMKSDSVMGFTRGAVFLYPSFVFTGLFFLTTDEIRLPQILALIFLAFMIFIGFVYLRIKPVKFHELEDLEQVYQYEQALKQNVIIHEITEEMMLKFQEANRYITENIENKRSYKAYRVLMHPIITTTISLGIVLMYLYLTGEL